MCCRVWTAADGLPSGDIHALAAGAQAPEGSKAPGVWVGTTKGLAYFDGQRVIIDSPVSGANIQALTVTPEGDLVASVAGRGVWQRTQADGWQTLGKGALVGEGPLALWAGQDGRIWAGTSNGLVYYQDRAWQRHPLLDDDKGLRVLAVLQDGDGGLWAGTELGLFLDPDAVPGGVPVVQHKAQRDGLINDHVRAIAADHDGGLWLGTIAGASRYAGGNWQAIRDPLLSGQRINTTLVDRVGRTWAGMERNGLALWDGTRWQRPSGAQGVPGNRIVMLFEDAVGRIWVSSGEGVGYFGPSESQQFTVLPGVPLVYAFEQDGKSGVWLATGDGLYRWNERDGLQPVPEFAGKRVNAIHQAADGTLWAGTRADGLLRLADGRLAARHRRGVRRAPLQRHRGERHRRDARRQPVGGDLQRRSVAAARRPVGTVGRQTGQPEGSVAQRRRGQALGGHAPGVGGLRRPDVAELQRRGAAQFRGARPGAQQRWHALDRHDGRTGAVSAGDDAALGGDRGAQPGAADWR